MKFQSIIARGCAGAAALHAVARAQTLLQRRVDGAGAAAAVAANARPMDEDPPKTTHVLIFAAAVMTGSAEF